MQLAARPWITSATVALAGASTIAATPTTPQLPDLLDLQSRAVGLTSGSSGIDLLTPWETVFNDANANLTSLVNNFGLAPHVGLQQAIVNQVGYLNEVLNDPSKISDVLTQMEDNLKTVLSSFLLVGASKDTFDTVTGTTLNGLHSALVSFLPSFLPSDLPQPVVEFITQTLNFLSSPVSGLLAGAAGPVISPMVALLNSAESVASALQAGDTTTALNDLLATPANFVGGFLNGATLNLDALVPLINNSGVLPSGTDLNDLSYAFGGLLSAGSVKDVYHLYDSSGDTVATVPAVGGSMLNGVGLNITTELDGHTITENFPAEPVSLLGAHIGHSQAIGALLGDGWDGKHNPPATPPLATLTFPTLDTSSASAVPADVLPTAVPADVLPADVLPTDLLSSFNPGDLADVPDHLINALFSLF